MMSMPYLILTVAGVKIYWMVKRANHLPTTLHPEGG